MSSLFDILNTGKQGMLASQVALQVTGQNIANINTKSYTRQTVDFKADATTGGVQVEQIRRERNALMDAQLLVQSQRYGYAKAVGESYIQIEQVFNEIEYTGIGKTFSEFFSSIEDLSQNPSELGNRDGLIAKAGNLISAFESASTQLMSVQENANLQIEGTISQINTILQNIAKVNEFIVGASSASYNQNQLLDQRQGFIEELSSLIPVNVITDQSGALTVLGMGGMTLVDSSNARHFITRASTEKNGLNDIIYVNDAGTEITFTNNITSGTLGGYLQIRDTIIPEELSKLDQLAAKFTNSFNQIHRAGVGMDGSTNLNFFSPNQAYFEQDWRNNGGSKITSSSIYDDTLLTFNEYEIRFTNATTFDIVNTTTGATVAGAQAYTSGAAINFEGISITISDDTGTPLAGDVYRVNTFTRTSSSMGINPAIEANPYSIAAGYTSAPGDNRNALDLTGLRSTLTMNNGQSTFEDYYGSQVTSVGIDSQQASRGLAIQEEMVTQIESLISSISGVSLDEEATKILQFQNAFDASSKIITVADELMQEIINLIR